VAMPFPDAYANKWYKTGQDPTLEFRTELHKDHNRNRIKK